MALVAIYGFFGKGSAGRNPTTTWTLDIMDMDQYFKKHPRVKGRNVYIALIDTGHCSYWDEFISIYRMTFLFFLIINLK